MGYPAEEDTFNRQVAVVEFPIDLGGGVRTLKDVSMREQLEMAAFM